jgi:hypothetical protein
MIDLTPLVEAIITLAATAVTLFLIPWLRERYGNETLNKAKSLVQIAVYAAEKVYGAGNGDVKLAYAQQVLAKHNIKLDTATIMAMIDAEIKQMEQAEIPYEDIVEEEIPIDEGVDYDDNELD